eukprot:ANDGO_00615.mRNA.1 Uncharacterized protein L509
MRFQLFSDVHTEFWRRNATFPVQINPMGADSVMLVGDIGVIGTNLMNPAMSQSGARESNKMMSTAWQMFHHFLFSIGSLYSRVFLIAGNHEYYHSDMKSAQLRIRELIRDLNKSFAVQKRTQRSLVRSRTQRLVTDHQPQQHHHHHHIDHGSQQSNHTQLVQNADNAAAGRNGAEFQLSLEQRQKSFKNATVSSSEQNVSIRSDGCANELGGDYGLSSQLVSHHPQRSFSSPELDGSHVNTMDGSRLDSGAEMDDASLDEPRFIFLDNEAWEHPTEPLTIIGSTLWTYVPPESEVPVQMGLNDYKYIGSPEDPFRPVRVWETNQLHFAAVKFLEEQLLECKRKERKCIILTHHAPLPAELSQPPEHMKSPVRSAFCTDLRYLMAAYGPDAAGPLRYWAFGHTHHNVDWTIAGVRVLSNQMGYVTDADSSFRTDLLLDV